MTRVFFSFLFFFLSIFLFFFSSTSFFFFLFSFFSSLPETQTPNYFLALREAPEFRRSVFTRF